MTCPPGTHQFTWPPVGNAHSCACGLLYVVTFSMSVDANARAYTLDLRELRSKAVQSPPPVSRHKPGCRCTECLSKPVTT